MTDYLIRTIAKEAGIRGLACVTTELTNEAVRRQNAAPPAAKLLAEALTGATLLGALLKIQQRVALKFEGNGPAKKVIVESDAYGKVRGYILNPHFEVPKVDNVYNTAVSLGTVGLLTVIKDLKLKELAESVIPLGGSPIGAELTLYLTQSEQIPSIVTIGALLNESGDIQIAGGLLLQAMPPYEPDVMVKMSDRLEELPPIAEMLKSNSPEQVLASVFQEMPYDILENRLLGYHCECSRARTEQALISLGAAELQKMIEAEEVVEVNCQFCQETYAFSVEDLENLLVELA